LNFPATNIAWWFLFNQKQKRDIKMKKSLFLFSVVIIAALGPRSAISLTTTGPGGGLEQAKCKCPGGKEVEWGALCPDGSICGLVPGGGDGPSLMSCECPDGTEVSYGATCPDGSVCENKAVLDDWCAAGYWWNGRTCSQCPLSDDGIRGTSPAGSDNSTDCYIPSGTTFADDSGSGVYTDNCHYSL